MWFMLMMLQCQKIRPPFNKPPPEQLELLRDLVVSFPELGLFTDFRFLDLQDPKVYEEILVANGDNMTWLDKVTLEPSLTEEGPERFKAAAPSKFYDSQPFPHEGVACYIAAFSDQSYP